jgi:hypothetical protein
MFIRSMVASTILLLGTSSIGSATEAAPEAAGSYDVLICTGSCSESGDGNVQVIGKLILFPTTLQQRDLDREHLSTGHFMHDPPNGCFGLDKVTGRSYEGYAGIEKAGLTSWSIEGGELLFALFHSPDAGYRVHVRRTEDGFAGTGKSWGAGVAAPKSAALDQVVLRRTGAADLSRCPRQKQ